MFDKFFKKKEFKVDKEQIDIATTIILEHYDVYEKGMFKEFIDSNIKMRVEIMDLNKKIEDLK